MFMLNVSVVILNDYLRNVILWCRKFWIMSNFKMKRKKKKKTLSVQLTPVVFCFKTMSRYLCSKFILKRILDSIKLLGF